MPSATGVEVCFTLAGPGARALAFLIDWVLRIVLAAAWYAAAAALYHGHWSLAAPLDAETRWFAGVVAPAAALYFLSPFVFEVALRGSSPGKRATGVRLTTASGDTPGAGALLLRNVFRLVDALPLLYGVGLITVMLRRDHARIGDLAAGTLLVYSSPAPQLTGGRDLASAWSLVTAYRQLARDCARARATGRSAHDEEPLERAYAQAHALLHRPAVRPLLALRGLFAREIPQAVTELRPHIAWVSALFVLAIAAGYALVATYPDLISLFASAEMIAAIKRGELWTESLLNIAPSAVLSVQVLANNVVVSLFAFCAGFLFGLGTFYIVALNGLSLGAIFAFTALYGVQGRLFSFVIPHGCVELSVMCLSGAAGAAVGEALIRPGSLPRSEAFQRAARRSGYVLVACVLLLVGCGLIEGYVSPRPGLALSARLAIGVGYWSVMVALLRGGFGPGPGRRPSVRRIPTSR